jgi:hypothetical protein
MVLAAAASAFAEDCGGLTLAERAADAVRTGPDGRADYPALPRIVVEVEKDKSQIVLPLQRRRDWHARRGKQGLPRRRFRISPPLSER